MRLPHCDERPQAREQRGLVEALPQQSLALLAEDRHGELVLEDPRNDRGFDGPRDGPRRRAPSGSGGQTASRPSSDRIKASNEALT